VPVHVTDLISIQVFIGVGAGFVLAMYAIVATLAPSRDNTVKLEPYECGETVIGQPWVHINIRYYIFAMIFLIFDIESVFLWPWALIFKKLGFFGLVEMAIFILILSIGLVYPWKKGFLEWDLRD